MTMKITFTEIFTLRIRLFNEKVGIITNKVKQIQQSTQSKSVVTEEILLQKSKQYDYWIPEGKQMEESLK